MTVNLVARSAFRLLPEWSHPQGQEPRDIAAHTVVYDSSNKEPAGYGAKIIPIWTCVALHKAYLAAAGRSCISTS